MSYYNIVLVSWDVLVRGGTGNALQFMYEAPLLSTDMLRCGLGGSGGGTSSSTSVVFVSPRCRSCDACVFSDESDELE